MRQFSTENTVEELKEVAEHIKKYYPKLTDFETLQIAVQLQANRIQCAAHVISETNKYPSALENIAIQLGTLPVDWDKA